MIQRIDLNSPERLRSVLVVQQSSPVDSYLRPEPAPMPGYQAKIIMAAGTFINGSTSELTADGPFAAVQPFVQGCLSYSMRN